MASLEVVEVMDPSEADEAVAVGFLAGFGGATGGLPVGPIEFEDATEVTPKKQSEDEP